MSTFTDETLLSGDGKTRLHVRRCVPEGEAKAVVQIAHGIAEHIGRYDDFAAFLAENGFVAAGNDHLGHGTSAKGKNDLGFFAETGGWDLAVGDMRKVYERVSAEYPGLPYFLFGHSMGSFLSRTYLIRFPDGLAGAILSGTGQQPGFIVYAGRGMGRREIKKHGARYKSPVLNAMAFGSYNQRFEPKRTVSDWLSRDPDEVDKYRSDPLCSFMPTAGLFTDMMDGFSFNQRKENLLKMKKDLPVYFMSGDNDPVGAYGKGVKKAYESFRKAGMTDLSIKLYPEGRHEMLNELNRGEVYQDILNWLNSKLKK